MERRSLADRLRSAWLWIVVVVLYLPLVAVGLASLSESRFFLFPIRKYSLKWYEESFASLQIRDALWTSVALAAVVGVIATVLAVFGALAYARHDWTGKGWYQQIVLAPIFFPQSVLGLALQLWFNTLGLDMTWHASVFAHLVWIAPIVTMVVAIQAYGYDASVEEAARDLGATRWMVFKDVTFPLLWPGVFSGLLFAVLLSWGNFPLSYFTSGADVTVPEWLYGKMIGGYTPMVPALGFLSVVAGGLVLAVGLAIQARLSRQP
ncbi:ABC transporter permease [Albimonas pacifica]|uniref:Spermidine/putrescine transport system permease protein n=1 Tax=Albimonas pacifica TaxID=1114924 RepID=A0A1I3DDP8_9RHOB|nr:ABC transporter permease [Albimonas pacifica]SFH84803.1 spermidine/putrescine transport system permease protein [Albimonas pacifica]